MGSPRPCGGREPRPNLGPGPCLQRDGASRSSPCCLQRLPGNRGRSARRAALGLPVAQHEYGHGGSPLVNVCPGAAQQGHAVCPCRPPDSGEARRPEPLSQPIVAPPGKHCAHARCGQAGCFGVCRRGCSGPIAGTAIATRSLAQFSGPQHCLEYALLVVVEPAHQGWRGNDAVHTKPLQERLQPGVAGAAGRRQVVQRSRRAHSDGLVARMLRVKHAEAGSAVQPSHALGAELTPVPLKVGCERGSVAAPALVVA
mmetsp:Transcript_24255/g.91530  ORF Transcript_24255/g.91530 Transcript_24255/m.91530 type:complete len:256 (-) Transcript_24255:279-1046(-)